MRWLFQGEWLLSDMRGAVRLRAARARVMESLKQGLSPRELAFTLALGFAIGCVPLLGVTTGICALLALVLRLNMPAIQAANWLAMPLQIVLLIPFLKLGAWLFPGAPVVLDRAALLGRIAAAPWSAVMQMGNLIGHALLAWLITAGPAAVLLAVLLASVLRRLPRLVAAED